MVDESALRVAMVIERVHLFHGPRMRRGAREGWHACVPDGSERAGATEAWLKPIAPKKPFRPEA